jgi:hypothetical protein
MSVLFWKKKPVKKESAVDEIWWLHKQRRLIHMYKDCLGIKDVDCTPITPYHRYNYLMKDSYAVCNMCAAKCIQRLYAKKPKELLDKLAVK